MAPSAPQVQGKDQDTSSKAVGASPSVSPLLELPTEIRLDIFKLVLQADVSLCRVEERDFIKPILVNLSLFTFNRKISAEAQDAFAEANVLRLHEVHVSTPAPGISRVRHLELASDTAEKVFQSHDSAKKLLDAFDTLPNLRTLSVAYDNLHHSVRDVHRVHNTLSGFEPLQCVSLGIFEAVSPADSKTTRKGKILFKSRSLVRDLPALKQTLHNSELPDLMLATRDLIKGDSFVSQKCVSAQFALWLATYDLWRLRGEAGGGTEWIPWYVSGLLQRFEQGMEAWVESGKDGVAWKNERLPKGVRVVDLVPGVHSAELLEWGTEIMTAALRNVVNSPAGKYGLGMGDDD